MRGHSAEWTLHRPTRSWWSLPQPRQGLERQVKDETNMTALAGDGLKQP